MGTVNIYSFTKRGARFVSLNEDYVAHSEYLALAARCRELEAGLRKVLDEYLGTMYSEEKTVKEIEALLANTSGERNG